MRTPVGASALALADEPVRRQLVQALRLRFPAAFEDAGEDDLTDVLPEGVYRVYPLPKESDGVGEI